MSEMIDRVAMAMLVADGQFNAAEVLASDNRVYAQTAALYRKRARAAIEEMRDPPQTNFIDGWEAMRGDWNTCADKAADGLRCWKAIIDSALA